jgi:hypothetical protein
MIYKQELRTAPRDLWAKPLDFNLHCTYWGEFRVPFALYVKPELAGSSCPAIPQFCLLPPELQLRVIHFCDSSTLFQLMQTSSFMRVEAKKLFWSYPDAWYCVDGAWLHDGGYTGDTELDIDFLACVEQLDVNLRQLGPRNWIGTTDYDQWENNLDKILAEAPVALFQRMDKRICDFWKILRRLCPRATHVVLSISAEWNVKNSLSAIEKRIVNMCPAGMSVFVSLFRGEEGSCLRIERSLWRLAGDGTFEADKWELISPAWVQRNILLPPKDFRGPVGWFQRSDYKRYRLNLQESASRVLLNQAIERHYFHERHESFDCFVPECNAQFHSPGEWTQHANETRHDDKVSPPDNVKALFDQHKKKLERLNKEMREAHRPIYKAWNLIKGHSGAESSRGPILFHQPEHDDEDQAIIYHIESEFRYECLEYDAELAFLYQIEHDPSYAQAKPPRESRLWELYNDVEHGI